MTYSLQGHYCYQKTPAVLFLVSIATKQLDGILFACL